MAARAGYRCVSSHQALSCSCKIESAKIAYACLWRSPVATNLCKGASGFSMLHEVNISWRELLLGAVAGGAVGWALRAPQKRDVDDLRPANIEVAAVQNLPKHDKPDWRELFEPFKPPGDVSSMDARSPPPAAWAPWRIWVSKDGETAAEVVKKQQTIQVQASGELDFPSGSKWRCAYGPVWFSPRGDGYDKPASFWVLGRPVNCSSDGWATHVQGLHTIIVERDARISNPGDQLEIYLDENGDRQMEYTVILRPAFDK